MQAQWWQRLGEHRPPVAEESDYPFVGFETRELVAGAEVASEPEREMAGRTLAPDPPRESAGQRSGRAGSNRRGSSKTVSSLVAEASATRTIDPSGTSLPCHSTSAVVIRPSYGTGGA